MNTSGALPLAARHLAGGEIVIAFAGDHDLHAGMRLLELRDELLLKLQRVTLCKIRIDPVLERYRIGGQGGANGKNEGERTRHSKTRGVVHENLLDAVVAATLRPTAGDASAVCVLLYQAC